MKKTIRLLLLLSLISSLGVQAECSDQFEAALIRHKNALPAKVLMYGLATVFAFPVGLSASSVESANQSAAIKQAQAFRVVKEAYAGAGPHLDHFFHDLEQKSGGSVDQSIVIDILIEADQAELCQSEGGALPTKQLNFMTYSRLVKHTLERL